MTLSGIRGMEAWYRDFHLNTNIERLTDVPRRFSFPQQRECGLHDGVKIAMVFELEKQELEETSSAVL